METSTRNRGFASMAAEKQREIARKGGRAAHEKGKAHEFTTDEARQAGMFSFDCMRQCVRLCVEAGKLRTDDVEEVAQSLWACIHGVVMLLITKGGFPFIEQTRLIDSVLDITLEGIRKK